MSLLAGSLLMVPPLEEEPWPTLGPQVCAWIERHLVHGPGDLRGQPARLDAEKRALIHRIYEVYPAGHAQAGRRRYKRVGISLRKGSAKTEFAAWLAAVELHPRGPVRAAGFDRGGQPIGVGVRDPYIPMVAYTEEQSEDLAYGALRVILELSRVARDFDIGLERILRAGGDGKAVALAAAPDARDGARTTFQHFDETHRFTLPRLKQAHRTMMANIPKRKLADAWSLETTTAPAPGEGSVAEATMGYALAVAEGRKADSRLFFFHRQASDGHDLTTAEGRRQAVLEASGPDVAEWSDIHSIVEQWDDPTADLAYLERTWLNRLVRASEHAFDARRWRELERPRHAIPAGALITLGFKGRRYNGAAGVIATEVATGHQQVLGAWEKPPGVREWEVPQDQVERCISDAFRSWTVWRLYADPPDWETAIATWAGRYNDGEHERVVAWRTRLWRKTAEAVRAYATAITNAELSHDGDSDLARHIGNSHRRQRAALEDEEGQPAWMIQAERPDSPNRIDLAVAAVLSWQARCDALALGVGRVAPSIYERRAPVVIDDEEAHRQDEEGLFEAAQFRWQRGPLIEDEEGSE